MQNISSFDEHGVNRAEPCPTARANMGSLDKHMEECLPVVAMLYFVEDNIAFCHEKKPEPTEPLPD
jgi:hypothetical protein